MADNVLWMEHYARASSSLRAAKLAKTSKVISGRSRSEAKATTPAQWAAGMPLVRQPLTVDSDCESAPATTPVPPRASMIEGQDQIMDDDIVRNSRTCQVFAISETTFRNPRGGMFPMDSDIDIGRRLIALREHHKLNQIQFAQALNLAKNTLNGYENGKRPLTLETAKRIRDRYGISVDWLLRGDIGQPGHELVVAFGPSPKILEDAKKPPPVKKRRKTA